MNERKTDILVIGAGMTGLSAAASLQSAGHQVVVIDKGRGVGGRMATRRIGGATFDHGAQFATSRDPRFENWLQQAQSAGVAVEWCKGFAATADGHTRWRGAPGMSALAKHLALGLDIVQEKEVSALRTGGTQWIVEMAGGETWSAGAIILTAPVQQSLVLLAAGGVSLDADMQTRLAAIQYERCLAVMAVLDAPSLLPPPGGFAPASGPLAWIADNQLKGISAEPAVTLHATHEFSLAHWDEDRQQTAGLMLDAASEWLGTTVKSFQVHGWRFSKPMQVDPEPCAIVHHAPPLILAGDAFAGPRVEGAAVSGWAAAEAFISHHS